MKLEEIIKIISQSEIKIRSFGVRRLGIFGSFVKGTNTESSDVIYWLALKTFLK